MKTIKKTISLCLVFIFLASSFYIAIINRNFDDDENEMNFNPKTQAGEITIITPKNITYTTPMSGYYPGTYGFENEKDGALPMDWTDESSGGSCSAQVISDLGGHNKVIELYDPEGTALAGVSNDFTAQTFGSYEFWIRTNDSSQLSSAWAMNGASNLFQFRIYSNKFQYFDGTINDIGLAASAETVSVFVRGD